MTFSRDFRISGHHLTRYGCILLFLILLSLPGASAADTPPAVPTTTGINWSSVPVHPGHRFTEEGPVLVFFYNTNCGDCLKTLPHILEYVNQHPELEVHLLNIRDSYETWQLFTVYREAYNTGPLPVPSLFVGNRVLIGYEEIPSLLNETVSSQSGVNVSNLTSSPSPTPPLVTNQPQGLALPLVITAGLVDGINPCAFSVLIILLFTLSAAGSRKNMVLVGVAFISSVFVFYFLSGLGLFYLIQSAAISRAIGIIAASIAFILGLVSLYDGIRGEGKPTLAIPDSKRGTIERYIQKASVPAALILGVLVGMFELPCTGGIYLAILSLISNQMTLVQGIPLLLIYNVFFVLPLILILGIVVLGLPLEKVDRWRQEHRNAVRIVMGLVLIGLGVLLISTFIGA